MMDGRARVLSMINAAWTTQVIHAACDLGLPDLMEAGPASAAALAARASAHGESVQRLLRAMATLGLCVEGPTGEFELTEDGAMLRSGDADSLNAWARMSGERIRDNWGRLAHCVRTGESARKALLGTDDFTYLDRDPAAAAVFNQAMVNLTRPVAGAAARELDWRGVAVAVDVGGGAGELIATLLERNPAMRGILFDLEHALAAGREHLARRNVADRCEAIAGSFFDGMPRGADGYLLKSVLHNWDDERALQILRNCAAAMAPKGRVVLLERVLPQSLSASAADREGARSDLNMLVGCGGCERTEARFRRLLHEAGLELREVRELRDGFSALVALRA